MACRKKNGQFTACPARRRKKNRAGPTRTTTTQRQMEERAERAFLNERGRLLDSMKSLGLTDAPMYRKNLDEYRALLANYRAKYPEMLPRRNQAGWRKAHRAGSRTFQVVIDEPISVGTKTSFWRRQAFSSLKEAARFARDYKRANADRTAIVIRDPNQEQEVLTKVPVDPRDARAAILGLRF